MTRKVFGHDAGRRPLSLNEQNALCEIVDAGHRGAHGWLVGNLRCLIARGFIEVSDAQPVQRRRVFLATAAGVAEIKRLRDAQVEHLRAKERAANPMMVIEHGQAPRACRWCGGSGWAAQLPGDAPIPCFHGPTTGLNCEEMNDERSRTIEHPKEAT